MHHPEVSFGGVYNRIAAVHLVILLVIFIRTGIIIIFFLELLNAVIKPRPDFIVAHRDIFCCFGLYDVVAVRLAYARLKILLILFYRLYVGKPVIGGLLEYKLLGSFVRILDVLLIRNYVLIILMQSVDFFLYHCVEFGLLFIVKLEKAVLFAMIKNNHV